MTIRRVTWPVYVGGELDGRPTRDLPENTNIVQYAKLAEVPTKEPRVEPEAYVRSQFVCGASTVLLEVWHAIELTTEQVIRRVWTSMLAAGIAEAEEHGQLTEALLTGGR